MTISKTKQTTYFATLCLLALASIIITTEFMSIYFAAFLLLGTFCVTSINQWAHRKHLESMIKEYTQKQEKDKVAHRHAQRRQAAMETLANMIPASIAMVSKDSTIQYANVTCKNWFARPDKGLEGQHLKTIIGTKNFEEYTILFEDVQQNNRPLTFNRNLITSDGKEVCYRISINAVEESNCLIFIEDITEVKEKEISLRKINLELESQINEKNQLKDRMLAVNNELQQFASVASHDMKEPLRTISSFSNLLARRIPDDKRSQEFLEFITDSAKRMTQLLEDLITYARTDLDQQTRKTVKLSDVILTVRNNLYSRIQETGAEIYVENLPTLNCHLTALTQVFQNILSNSIKFQKENQNPKILVTSTTNTKNCTVKISDNGIGIEEQYLDQIFDPFRRLHSRAEFEGSGIGLATCKKIMDEYQGKVAVESEVGVGTTFILTFPLEMVVQNEVQALEAIA
jgi:PAS domain S-box-containing protein